MSSGGHAATTASAVIQRWDFGGSRARIYARPLDRAGDRFRCPTAIEGAIALVMHAQRNGRECFATKGLAASAADL